MCETPQNVIIKLLFSSVAESRNLENNFAPDASVDRGRLQDFRICDGKTARCTCKESHERLKG